MDGTKSERKLSVSHICGLKGATLCVTRQLNKFAVSIHGFGYGTGVFHNEPTIKK